MKKEKMNVDAEGRIKCLTLHDGRIFLNGEAVDFLRSYKIVGSAEERGFAELTMVITVRTDTESEVITWNTQKRS